MVSMLGTLLMRKTLPLSLVTIHVGYDPPVAIFYTQVRIDQHPYENLSIQSHQCDSLRKG